MAQRQRPLVRQAHVQASLIGQGGHQRLIQAEADDTVAAAQRLAVVRLLQGLAQQRHLRRIAAPVVEQRQPQGHQEDPPECRASCGQHQAFPDRRALACGAPAHQRAPRQRGQHRNGERQGGEMAFKPGCESGHVGCRLGWNAGLDGQPDDPDHDG